MPFEIGNVVELKSGGEPMTVEGVSEDSIDCVWFNGKKVERSSFNPATLAIGVNPLDDFK